MKQSDFQFFKTASESIRRFGLSMKECAKVFENFGKALNKKREIYVVVDCWRVRITRDMVSWEQEQMGLYFQHNWLLLLDRCRLYDGELWFVVSNDSGFICQHSEFCKVDWTGY